MKSEMDLEDLSELSELEEGEIHDDVEIISEYIPNPKKKPTCLPLPRKNILCSKKAIPHPKPAYGLSSRDKVESRGNKTNRTNRENSVHRLKSQPSRAGQSSKKSTSANNITKSRSRSTSNSLTPPHDKSRAKQQTKPASNSGIKSRESEPRSSSESKVNESRNRKIVNSEPIIEKQQEGSPKENRDSVSDNKWKNTFETVSSVDRDSNMSISSEDDQDDDDDEVMMLRLAALNSLDSNVRPKVPADAQNSSDVLTPTLEIPALPPVNEDEDEDEELLRAQLLIEVARKQTMESESQQQTPELKTSDLGSIVRTESKPEIEIRTLVPPLKNSLLTIPKADRLVIDLRNDSDSSSDEEGSAVEDSIAALLKSARQTVEKKADIAQSIPKALSHLPRHQQEEYQRLKQEILRREQNRLLQAQQASSKPATPTGPPEDSNSDTTTANTTAPPTVATSAAPRVIVANIPQLLPASKSVVAQVSASVHSEEVAKENAKATTPPTPRSSPAASRLAVLKQQLARKRRDLAVTKETLQKQLELVDRNRNLWLKSREEASRLKTMLQQAEETEKQLREQFTSSQQQTQRLKTRMQSVERNIMLLHNGLGINRKRTTSLKIRLSMSPKSSPKVSASPFPFLSPSSATFKVKPRIIAKALAKTRVPYSKMTYTKPSLVGQIASSTGSSVPAAAQNLVRLTVKQSGSRSRQKKTLTDEQWLFGTLGDEWDDTKTNTRPSTYIPWLSKGHASKSTSSSEMRLDPSRVVCRYDLDSACQDANCSFQHLPPPSASSLYIGMAINDVSSHSSTAATSASQVARASAASSVAVGGSSAIRPKQK